MPKVRAIPLLTTLLTLATGCGPETPTSLNPTSPETVTSADTGTSLAAIIAPTATWRTGGQNAVFTVPAGKTLAEFQLWGGGGGGGAPGAGGGGAWIHATLPVTAGDSLLIRVASGGDAYGGGGGASYVLLNGQVMLIAAGGGGGGTDGCGGCTQEASALAGAGGAGGPVGGNGQNGRANNYEKTNSGAGGGATQTAGGKAGISNDQNPHGYDECTSNGFAGGANQGGAARVCEGDSTYAAANYNMRGEGIGNGSGGGGGAGRHGGGSGAHKWTYTGGGGGGGSSWVHSSVTVLENAGGSSRQPGGTSSIDYANSAGLGGAAQSDDEQLPKAGAPGLVVLRLRGSSTPPTATWRTGGQNASFVVPAGKNRAEFQLWGGGGGGGAPGGGGGGAWIHATLPVLAGDTLQIRVASGGAAYGGGGGGTYVLRNGQIMLVAAGGGGGGVDGCGGCSDQTTDPLAGAGGAGGPSGGNGQNGRANNDGQTNSGAGGGGTQTAGGKAGISNDQNPYGYDECTSDGFTGYPYLGGPVRMCTGETYTPANYNVGGQGIGNGSGGGGGSGYFGGGSGAHKWTYTGGGGGGGSSWIHPIATLIETEGGNARQPGGRYSADYANSVGLGGAPRTSASETSAQAGTSGLAILRL